MVQLLILYFFSIKPTHGYEIQKFIQLNHMSEWNTIKSGSIYYAIQKLERDGFICLVEKVGEGEKKKQIYKITDSGRKRLHTLALEEIEKPLQGISSEKFLLYPMIANLSKEEVADSIKCQQETLKEQLAHIRQWEKEKEKNEFPMEQVTLAFMKQSVENQMMWHQELLAHLEQTMLEAEQISNLIRTIDYTTVTI